MQAGRPRCAHQECAASRVTVQEMGEYLHLQSPPAHWHPCQKQMQKKRCVLDHLGHPHAANYDGGTWEWSADPDRPLQGG